jgi:phosphonate metabolism-associated iron-containing alcohol dehydrogenase
MPTKIFFSSDSLGNIKKMVGDFSPRNILLITGKKSMEKSGILGKMKNFLHEFNIFHYNNVEQNPSIETIDKGVIFLKKHDCDFVIGLGGGSALDTAKSIAILANNDGSVREYLLNKKTIENKSLPFIAIPTTSGTGSEVTPWASIWDKNEKRKYSLANEFMFPKIALVDPTLTLTMPKDITAITGLDALSHAIEAYWSKNSQEISDVFALEAIKLIFKNLKKVYDDPDNLKYRENMSKASLFAGLAFSNTKTTAVHSVSYPITAYFNVPHGLACAITLPEFFEFNVPSIDEDKSLRLVKACNGETIEDAALNIQKLIRELDLPTKLSDLGISKKDTSVIIKESFTQDRVTYNPRKLTEKKLKKILERLL